MNSDHSWMYNKNNPGRVGMILEFAEGVTRFINHAKTFDDFLTSREKKREEVIAVAKEVENKRYATLQTQLTFLFESGNILPPCPTSSDGSDHEGDENDKSDKESEGDENGRYFREYRPLEVSISGNTDLWRGWLTVISIGAAREKYFLQYDKIGSCLVGFEGKGSGSDNVKFEEDGYGGSIDGDGLGAGKDAGGGEL
ncbi:hypothetical protein H5410_036513 [Solanum commersonii]|uniref:Uncharacterized protein n=1 Tax=Solanum commersonii TaxID=4109 RepID=A0A9J5Y4F7_SOLCO|nr:hypothetical protein H5410_036513 [Solanum commersonii]